MNDNPFPKFDPTSDIDTIRALFNRLVDTLHRLKASIREDADSGLGAKVFRIQHEHLHPLEANCHPWVTKSFTGNFRQHEMIMTAFAHMAFEKDSDANRTFSFPGVIAASPNTIELAKEVNEIKAEFKQSILLFKKDNRSVNDADIGNSLSPRSGEGWVEAAAKSVFGKAGLSGICVKEAYRLIPIIADNGICPERIKHYYKPNQPSRKTTVGAVLTLLSNKRSMGDNAAVVEHAIGVLSEMPANQVIAERQTTSEAVTANYKLPKNGDVSAKWKTISGVMPIIIPAATQDEVDRLTDFNSLNEAYTERQCKYQEKSLQVTAQSVWEPVPFLAGLKLHLPLKR